MSHLIIEQGKDVGKEIAVPAAGMKFGRSPANDLVLDDEAVMLFQGRLFFKSDGALWVTDFSAGDKTTVNGETVAEQQLKVGDLVAVGSYAFRIIQVALNAPETAAPPPAEEEEIDLGFKPEKKSRATASKGEAKSSSLVHRVLQLVVVLLVLLVLVVAVPRLLKMKNGSRQVSQPKPDSFSFVYECVRANPTNIFRYHLELVENGTAAIRVDDLKNRHIAKSAVIPPEDLEKLSRKLSATGFFDVEGDRVMEAEGRYEFCDIAIVRNGEFNQVRILNREPPMEVKEVVSLLEDFVSKQLDLPFTLLEEPAVLLRYARQSFKLGESRYAERDVRYGNLAESIKHFEEAALYLEIMEPKPELYRQAMKRREQAGAEQDARYKDYMFNAERAMRLGDWQEASKQLKILAQLIPDRDDERYKTISAKQLDVEDHLR